MFITILACLACRKTDSGRVPRGVLPQKSSPFRTFSKLGKVGFTLPDFHFPYHLNSPINSWKLDHDLDEISGLAWNDVGELACIQDERGDLFLYDFGEKHTKPALDFGKQGDYEGIAKVKGKYWVVRSDGQLFSVKRKGKKKKFATFLAQINDVEGLAYQQAQNRLLLACKGLPGKAVHLRNHKAIYAFDLKSKRLLPQPVYTVNLDELKQFLPPIAKKSRIEDPIFGPSGIAVHPLTGDIYLVAHAGKLLLVLSHSGKLQYVERLAPQLFPQPEGICFSPQGHLFIANEGTNKRGRILHFEPF
ncbi:MAG TPA: hypothetical protein ENJ82_00500 [Bacteroidetes bacterium]|nr:hypothetical protein [Bacteroidota bacterium]